MFLVKCSLLLPLIYLSIACNAQNVTFAMPLNGVNSKDFFICRYVDHDTSSNIRDTYCRAMTYDGHKGTDFLLKNFNKMDSGVTVYAVADGRVFDFADGNFDREKTLDKLAKPNFVAIIHKQKLCTYYLHLMKNSVMVKVGDSVKSGQAIGKVGSSGYSTSPHLHFEVIDSNRHVVDPFAGNCAAGRPSLWAVQPICDTALYLIEDGFIPYLPNLDDLQERLLVRDTFEIKNDTMVAHWVLVHGLRKGNRITAQWISPGGSLWSTFTFVWRSNEAYAYSWPYIKTPPFKGKWKARFFVDEQLIAERSFFMKKKKR